MSHDYWGICEELDDEDPLRDEDQHPCAAAKIAQGTLAAVFGASS
jgi:hypothetical protein